MWTLIFWLCMSLGVWAAYLVLHAMTVVVYHIIAIFVYVCWAFNADDDEQFMPGISDVA